MPKFAGIMSRKFKNKILEKVPIESIAAEGKCIARVNGQVVFVKDVAPGDIADLKVIRKKKKFLEAIPLQIHQYSEARTEPFCQHFWTCGGCKWQHIDYQTQLYYKRRQVIDSLERIAQVQLPEINPIIASEDTRYYRNKLEFTFSNKKWLTKEEIDSGKDLDRDALGFHMPGRFDKIIDIDHCHLQPDPSNPIRLAVKQYARKKNLSFYDIVKQEGFLRNLIIRTANTGQVMVIIQFGYEDQQQIKELMHFTSNRFPEITSLQYVINPKKNETFHDLEVTTFAGEPFITEQMEGLRFRIGPKSFYQTNSSQASELYKIIRNYAGLKGNELVYDLYTGTGTIANFAAQRAKKVIGIEYIASAIEDARVNSVINNITNTGFFAGDIKDILNDDFLERYGQPDVVITDPPRAGMHEDVVGTLLKTNAKKIVYVSCNPATQARDIAKLDTRYEVKAVQPVDMFPHTYHVENVALLVRRG